MVSHTSKPVGDGPASAPNGAAASASSAAAATAAIYNDLLDKRAKIYKTARRMVEKHVPDNEDKEVEVSEELGNLVEEERREARTRLDHTFTRYSTWCAKQQVPVLPIFALISALFVYDAAVQNSQGIQQQHRLKMPLSERRALVSDMSWLADRANKHYTSLKEKAGHGVLAPPRFAPAIRELSQTDEEGHLWEELHVEAQPEPTFKEPTADVPPQAAPVLDQLVSSRHPTKTITKDPRLQAATQRPSGARMESSGKQRPGQRALQAPSSHHQHPVVQAMPSTQSAQPPDRPPIRPPSLPQPPMQETHFESVRRPHDSDPEAAAKPTTTDHARSSQTLGRAVTDEDGRIHLPSFKKTPHKPRAESAGFQQGLRLVSSGTVPERVPQRSVQSDTAVPGHSQERAQSGAAPKRTASQELAEISPKRQRQSHSQTGSDASPDRRQAARVPRKEELSQSAELGPKKALAVGSASQDASSEMIDRCTSRKGRFSAPLLADSTSTADEPTHTQRPASRPSTGPVKVVQKHPSPNTVASHGGMPAQLRSVRNDEQEAAQHAQPEKSTADVSKLHPSLPARPTASSMTFRQGEHDTIIRRTQEHAQPDQATDFPKTHRSLPRRPSQGPDISLNGTPGDRPDDIIRQTHENIRSLTKEQAETIQAWRARTKATRDQEVQTQSTGTSSEPQVKEVDHNQPEGRQEFSGSVASFAQALSHPRDSGPVASSSSSSPPPHLAPLSANADPSNRISSSISSAVTNPAVRWQQVSNPTLRKALYGSKEPTEEHTRPISGPYTAVGVRNSQQHLLRETDARSEFVKRKRDELSTQSAEDADAHEGSTTELTASKTLNLSSISHDTSVPAHKRPRHPPLGSDTESEDEPSPVGALLGPAAVPVPAPCPLEATEILTKIRNMRLPALQMLSPKLRDFVAAPCSSVQAPPAPGIWLPRERVAGAKVAVEPRVTSVPRFERAAIHSDIGQAAPLGLQTLRTDFMAGRSLYQPLLPGTVRNKDSTASPCGCTYCANIRALSARYLQYITEKRRDQPNEAPAVSSDSEVEVVGSGPSAKSRPTSTSASELPSSASWLHGGFPSRPSAPAASVQSSRQFRPASRREQRQSASATSTRAEQPTGPSAPQVPLQAPSRSTASSPQVPRAPDMELVGQRELMRMPPPFAMPYNTRGAVSPMLNLVAGLAWIVANNFRLPSDMDPQTGMSEEIQKVCDDFQATLKIASHPSYFGPELPFLLVVLCEEVFTAGLKAKIHAEFTSKMHPEGAVNERLRAISYQLFRLCDQMANLVPRRLVAFLCSTHPDVQQLYTLFAYHTLDYTKGQIDSLPLPLPKARTQPKPAMAPPAPFSNPPSSAGSLSYVPPTSLQQQSYHLNTFSSQQQQQTAVKSYGITPHQATQEHHQPAQQAMPLYQPQFPYGAASSHPSTSHSSI